MVYGKLHPKAPQAWALLELPLRNTPCFQRGQHVLPITRCGWLGVGEAAVSFSSKHFALFSSASQLSFRSNQARHFWRQPKELPAAPVSLEPSTSLFFFLLQDTILLELTGRKQRGFRAIFQTCNGAEPLFCQKVFYVFILLLAVQLPFSGTSEQLSRTSFLPKCQTGARGGQNSSCPISPEDLRPQALSFNPSLDRNVVVFVLSSAVLTPFPLLCLSAGCSRRSWHVYYWAPWSTRKWLFSLFLSDAGCGQVTRKDLGGALRLSISWKEQKPYIMWFPC